MKLLDFFNNYKALPHQVKALQELESLIDPKLLSKDQDWYKTWSTQPTSSSDSDAVVATKYAPAIALIKEFEGCVLKAYPDPGTGGEPWTIGYGNTRYPDGTKIKPGDVITQQKANEMLADEVNTIVKFLAVKVPHWFTLNLNQQSALISFSFNVGMYWYNSVGFRTLSNVIYSRLWNNVPETLLLYVNPGTTVTAGLRRRRVAEGNLWLRKDS